jgi:hypothetical protein
MYGIFPYHAAIWIAFPYQSYITFREYVTMVMYGLSFRALNRTDENTPKYFSKPDCRRTVTLRSGTI